MKDYKKVILFISILISVVITIPNSLNAQTSQYYPCTTDADCPDPTIMCCINNQCRPDLCSQCNKNCTSICTNCAQVCYCQNNPNKPNYNMCISCGLCQTCSSGTCQTVSNCNTYTCSLGETACDSPYLCCNNVTNFCWIPPGPGNNYQCAAGCYSEGCPTGYTCNGCTSGNGCITSGPFGGCQMCPTNDCTVCQQQYGINICAPGNSCDSNGSCEPSNSCVYFVSCGAGTCCNPNTGACTNDCRICGCNAADCQYCNTNNGVCTSLCSPCSVCSGNYYCESGCVLEEETTTPCCDANGSCYNANACPEGYGCNSYDICYLTSCSCDPVITNKKIAPIISQLELLLPPLEATTAGQQLMATYDPIGPEVANTLSHDSGLLNYARGLTEKYGPTLIKVVAGIDANNLDPQLANTVFTHQDAQAVIGLIESLTAESTPQAAQQLRQLKDQIRSYEGLTYGQIAHQLGFL